MPVEVVLGVVAHSQAAHDCTGSLVGSGRVGDDLGESELSEGMVQHGGGGLGRVTVTPSIGRKMPADVDQRPVGSVVAGYLESDVAEEPPIDRSFHRPEPEPVLVEARLGFIDELVGLRPAHGLEAVAHHLGVGVDLGESPSVFIPPAAQQEAVSIEAWRLHDVIRSPLSPIIPRSRQAVRVAVHCRRVVVLGPMPVEMDAIGTAFGLARTAGRWTGRVGGSGVTGIHTGMGPSRTRAVLNNVLALGERVDHVMIAGVCGGLDPAVPVGTPINPDTLLLHATGATYVHRPPGDVPVAGTLITTEGVSLDPVLTQGFFERGCVAVDMESAAVAEVCEAAGIPWSVYRCVSDRPFDGLLDDGIVAATNPDGSVDVEAITRLLAADPTLSARLERLARDVTNAARLAAESAVRGCLALDG